MNNISNETTLDNTQAATSKSSDTVDLSEHLPSWKNALKLNQCLPSISELFRQDSQRAQDFSCRAGGLFLDYSKSNITREVKEVLFRLAEEAGLPSSIEHLLNGHKVNTTEHRAAWHTLLRQPESTCPEEHRDNLQEVLNAHKQMQDFVDQIHSGQWRGHNQNTITDVVNIGIGGSDLGPRMITRAISDFKQDHVRVHFVANIDGAEIHHTLKQLNPVSTLFIIASKSFSTQETLANGKTARQWLLDNGCPEDGLCKHLVAISTNTKAATEFGIAADNIFPMWDWVGGRYSLWSTIGLPIAIAVGWDNFQKLLDGAHQMDRHFAKAPLDENMPVLLALITFWYNQCQNARSQAILPYCHQLQLLPNFLQQLDMESLGKGVNLNGERIGYSSGLLIWGTEESNGQHSFHQLFHQGTQVIPVDFITPLKANHPHAEQHAQLLNNCLSQGQALMQGKTLAQAKQEIIDSGKCEADAEILAPHKVIEGNKPSNTIFMDQLTPNTLGALIAMYEHKVFCLSVLLNINAFDQWGVELGKQLSKEIEHALQEGDIPTSWDASTRQLAEMILSSRN